jgi:hypothetical protein
MSFEACWRWWSGLAESDSCVGRVSEPHPRPMSTMNGVTDIFVAKIVSRKNSRNNSLRTPCLARGAQEFLAKIISRKSSRNNSLRRKFAARIIARAVVARISCEESLSLQRKIARAPRWSLWHMLDDITKKSCFDCAVALCAIQNALLVISNLTWLWHRTPAAL